MAGTRPWHRVQRLGMPIPCHIMVRLGRALSSLFLLCLELIQTGEEWLGECSSGFSVLSSPKLEFFIVKNCCH